MRNAELHALSSYRMQKAKDCLATAQSLVETDPATSLNRSYYAVFHAMRAVMALDERDFKKHSALISYFRQTYIKPGLFPTSCSKTIEDLFRIRQKSDYEDFYLISKAEVEKQASNAALFMEAIAAYLAAQSAKPEND